MFEPECIAFDRRQPIFAAPYEVQQAYFLMPFFHKRPSVSFIQKSLGLFDFRRCSCSKSAARALMTTHSILIGQILWRQAGVLCVYSNK